MHGTKKRIIGIIPARMSSWRFPGKPLEKILNIPMVGHVYKRSKMSRVLDEVYIATCDPEIKSFSESVGAPCVMTADTHERASDRVAEAVLKIEKEKGQKLDIVVMIQGDEPMITPEMIDMSVKPFEDPNIEVVNLMAPIRSEEEHLDPNCPKVVVDKNNFALYFSREPIPSRKKWNGEQERKLYKQVCIIPFKRDFLLEFNALEPSPLERIESIDMNRCLEYGHKVKMVYEEFETYCVDTPKDKEKVEKLMASDPLVGKYA